MILCNASYARHWPINRKLLIVIKCWVDLANYKLRSSTKRDFRQEGFIKTTSQPDVWIISVKKCALALILWSGIVWESSYIPGSWTLQFASLHFFIIKIIKIPRDLKVCPWAFLGRTGHQGTYLKHSPLWYI